MTWVYKTVLNACMSLIAWAIDWTLQHGRRDR